MSWSVVTQGSAGLQENPEGPQEGWTQEVESSGRESSAQGRTREQTQRLRQAH